MVLSFHVCLNSGLRALFRAIFDVSAFRVSELKGFGPRVASFKPRRLYCPRVGKHMSFRMYAGFCEKLFPFYVGFVMRAVQLRHGRSTSYQKLPCMSNDLLCPSW